MIPGLQCTALGAGNSPAQACAGRFEASCPLGDLWDSSSGGAGGASSYSGLGICCLAACKKCCWRCDQGVPFCLNPFSARLIPRCWKM